MPIGRSGWILTLGAGGIGLLMLSRCMAPSRSYLPPRIVVYSSAAACTAAGHLLSQCQAGYAEAHAAYETGELHISAQSCERETNVPICVPDVTGTRAETVYRPPFAGFALGAEIGMPHSLPIYYDKDGFARVAGTNGYIGTRCRFDSLDACNPSSGSSGAWGGGSGHWWSGKQGGSPEPFHPMIERGGFGLHLGHFFGG